MISLNFDVVTDPGYALAALNEAYFFQDYFKLMKSTMTPDDFLEHHTGDASYYFIARALFELDPVAPPDSGLFLCKIQKLRDASPLVPVNREHMLEVLNAFFGHIPKQPNMSMVRLHREFVRARRILQIKSSTDDILVMTEAVNRLNMELPPLNFSQAESAVAINPFEKLLIKTESATIPTGLRTLDSKLGGGSHYGELTVLVGGSGGGKTAISNFFAGQAAAMGFDVLYVSGEEQIEDLANRYYANEFGIDYSQLHAGKAIFELEQTYREWFQNLTPRKQSLLKHLKLLDLRQHIPLTIPMIEMEIQKLVNQGFVPQLVFIDQLQFLVPSTGKKDSKDWEQQRDVLIECDRLSHTKFNGQPISLWVMHQSKGKWKAIYNNTEIDGYKGIVHKPENIFTIGRLQEDGDEYVLASMKCRHHKNFRVKLKGELQYMRYTCDETQGELPDTVPHVPSHGQEKGSLCDDDEIQAPFQRA